VVRIPTIEVGSLRLHDIGALAIGPGNDGGDFIDWYSKKNPEPFIGWLGGNVLHGFRITIDYPNRVAYWLSQTPLDPYDLDQVGVTLVSKNGEYFVGAIALQNGKPTVEEVQVGDKLLRVDSVQLSTATWGAVFAALHGKPGEVRTLLVERDGKQFVLKAIVTAF
jgi:hypothetical protein